jgi:hypothetical protein
MLSAVVVGFSIQVAAGVHRGTNPTPMLSTGRLAFELYCPPIDEPFTKRTRVAKALDWQAGCGIIGSEPVSLA